MSQAPHVVESIDPAEFSRRQLEMQGIFALSALPRLADSVVHGENQLAFEIAGRVGKRDELLLELKVRGELQLECQRCLEPVVWQVDVAAIFELRSNLAELSQSDMEDDTRDFLAMNEPVLLSQLVEEEVLLSLPLVPRHEMCVAPGDERANGQDSPFSALAALKKHIH
jgi:uncharacterized protein